MLINLRAAVAAIFITALTACSVSPTQPPVEEGSAAPPIEREPGAVPDSPAAGTIPDTAANTRPTAATASLLAAAAAATERESYTDAISYLERAVRIEPRNAQLWIALSDAHLGSGNLVAANQHVRKAIALAGSDPELTRSAWLQLADVREAEGNLSEARAIRRRYTQMRG